MSLKDSFRHVLIQRETRLDVKRSSSLRTMVTNALCSDERYTPSDIERNANMARACRACLKLKERARQEGVSVESVHRANARWEVTDG
jgi:hypothetical protein